MQSCCERRADCVGLNLKNITIFWSNTERGEEEAVSPKQIKLAFIYLIFEDVGWMHYNSYIFVSTRAPRLFASTACVLNKQSWKSGLFQSIAVTKTPSGTKALKLAGLIVLHMQILWKTEQTVQQIGKTEQGCSRILEKMQSKLGPDITLSRYTQKCYLFFLMNGFGFFLFSWSIYHSTWIIP